MKPADEPDPIMRASVLAKWLDITPDYLAKFARDKEGLKAERPGCYHGPNVMQAWARHKERMGKRAAKSDTAYSKEAEQARKAHWEANKAQLDYETRAGELIPLEVLQRFLDDLVAAILSVIQQEVLDKSAQEVIFSRIREIKPEDYLGAEDDAAGDEGSDGGDDPAGVQPSPSTEAN